MLQNSYDPLVTAAWLAEWRDHVRVLDASWTMPGAEKTGAQLFADGHIPGAARFDIDDVADQDSPLPHMLPSPEAFAAAMTRLGVAASDAVVVYDALGTFSAPRVWWSFRAMGHERVAVLDGGLPAWRDAGFAIEDGPAPSVEGAAPHFYPIPGTPRLVATIEDVQRALAKGEPVVDARPAARFSGAQAEPRPGLRCGHMPGARNIPWVNLLNEGRLKGEADLRSLFEGIGVDPAAPLICTCGSGITAALLALALARLGNWNARIYDGSWAEWGARDDLPIASMA